MGVARAWSRSEMGNILPSLSVNFIIYLQNVWSAMSLSLLVPEEKKLPISINFQKSVYPLYIYYSAGKRDRGKKTPPGGGGRSPPLHRTGGEAPCSMKGRKTRREENVLKGVG